MALYPPIVASSMPAFGVTDTFVRVYFTISNYNSIKLIDGIQISVRRQSSNANAVGRNNLVITRHSPLQRTDLDKALNRYFVTIHGSELIGGFLNNVFYKVQLRFITKKDKKVEEIEGNILSFSLWSTVCLIKPIIKPVFYIDDFKTSDILNDEANLNFQELDDENTYYSVLADFIGVYSPGEGRLILKNWRLRLLDLSYLSTNYTTIENYTLADSGIVLVNAYNYVLDNNLLTFSCHLPYLFKEDNKHYKLLFEILTRNGYVERKVIEFISRTSSITSSPNVDLSYSINEEDGYVKINIESNVSLSTNIVLRRTDSSSNFLNWEDLKFYKLLSTDLGSIVYYDFTVQSGTLYKYLIQSVDIRGRRSNPVYAQYQEDGLTKQIPGVILEYDNAFLLESTGNGTLAGVKQLKLKFDFQLSSYKYNILESKTDTLGSKYPFIKRNGDMYYRSFDCTGTITGFMDEAELFIAKNLMYDNKKDLYDMFKGEILNYTEQYDYTYERKFREKVELFLYNSKPKLYKSMQLGNIFIKLMNVSLSPKNELGRLIYTFSATAYEIAPCSILTYIKYGFITPGTYDTTLSNIIPHFGQLSSYNVSSLTINKKFKAGKDIIGAGLAPAADSIAKKINYKEPIDGTICQDFDIDWIRITVDSPPYLIIKDGDSYRPVEEDETILDPLNNLYQMLRTHGNFNSIQLDALIYLGTLFDLVIDNMTQSIIIAPPNSVYEINLSDFVLNGKSTKIIPRKDTLMSVDYHVNCILLQDESLVPIKVRGQTVMGQLLLNHFEKNTNVISKIKYKYLFTNKQESKKMTVSLTGVNRILIDTLPGVKVRIKVTDGSEEEFVINHTGLLDIDLSNQSNNYIQSYVIEDSVDALITYNAILKRSYFA